MVKKSDQQHIRDLAALLEETGLSEIEIETEGLRVRVARQGAVSAPLAPSAPAQAASSASPAAEVKPEEVPGEIVPSPMVGTVYLSSEPGAAPFVKIGDTVSEGDSLLIIEAMKTMNHVPAPKGGRVREILVRDGQPVEFGEPLVRLD